jgi:hypothetical protein
VPQEKEWKNNYQSEEKHMARNEAKVIRAQEGLLIFETEIGKDFRVQVPKNVRHNIETDGKVRITIEKT